MGLLSSVDGFNSVGCQARHYGQSHVQSDSSDVLISGSDESSSGLVRSCRPAGKALRWLRCLVRKMNLLTNVTKVLC